MFGCSIIAIIKKNGSMKLLPFFIDDVGIFKYSFTIIAGEKRVG